jgi:hypothetical protein
LIGRGDVTFLYIAFVKSTKNIGKLTCVFGRFKNPFFLSLMQILKGDDDHGYGDCIFLVIYAQPSHNAGHYYGTGWFLPINTFFGPTFSALLTNSALLTAAVGII